MKKEGNKEGRESRRKEIKKEGNKVWKYSGKGHLLGARNNPKRASSRGGSRDALPHSDPTKPSAEPFRDSDRGTSPNSIGMDMPVVGEIMPARVGNATLWTLPGAAWAQSCSGGARHRLSKDALGLALSLVLSAVQHLPVGGEKNNFRRKILLIWQTF